MQVTGEVEVDVLHGDDLGPAAAGGTALDTENGAERGLTDSDGDVLADAAQAVGETDGGGLALARGGGVDGGHKDELALGSVFALLQQAKIDLCLVGTVGDKIFGRDTGGFGDLCDGAGRNGLGDLDIGKHDTTFLSCTFTVQEG